ncbi:hypothetical protein ACFQ1S_13100 [Kibdelosporangium lantanae]|uniref:Uncharacterized protein n=1 Tax=Kibdelosporangium lantanae TaxID=1497396 RepID=A0ABW3M6S8_9PSEU
MSLRDNALQLMTSWRSDDPTQESLRQAYLGFLLAREDACDRSCEPGHLTASGIVLDASGTRILYEFVPSAR